MFSLLNLEVVFQENLDFDGFLTPNLKWKNLYPSLNRMKL